MTNNQINTINRYFDSKHMDRRQLEAVLDFDNLTMDEKYISEIRELFKSNEDEAGEDIIKGYVRFVKSRSGSGVITWDEFMTRLDVLALEYSDFGIRVQRFSKPAYWEIFFNHFDITDYEDGDIKLTFNQNGMRMQRQKLRINFCQIRILIWIQRTTISCHRLRQSGTN